MITAIKAQLPVLILVLVDLGGKEYAEIQSANYRPRLNPCFGGFGWESSAKAVS